ncbi:MAG TPA: hypothetical protein PLS90_02125 [Candidatus Sumerlaeota bacterium]|nr:hypothetical protein [Candidatus Sumerlaeota bacterium]HPK01231.1 hypothetical protein [Candidatus Sumerlaeota bacterium]
MRLPRWMLIALIGFIMVPAARAVENIRIHDFDIQLNSDTGGIISLSHDSVGLICQTAPADAGLLTLSYPFLQFTPMLLGAEYSDVAIESEGETIILRWSALGPSRTHVPLPDGPVSGAVRLAPHADGKSLSLQAEVNNPTSFQVYQVLFPDLRGWRPMPSAEDTRLQLPDQVLTPLVGPVLPPDRDPFYPPYIWKQFAFSGSARWVRYGNEGSGVRIEQTSQPVNPVTQILTHRDEADPSYLRIVWQHSHRIEPGQNWQSGEFLITPY